MVAKSDIEDVEARVSDLVVTALRNIPLSLFGFLIVQASAGIWFASSFHQQFQEYRKSSDERYVTMTNQMTDRYRAAQANADFKLRDERIQRNAIDIRNLTVSIAKIDKKLDDRFDKLFEYLHNNEVSPRKMAVTLPAP